MKKKILSAVVYCGFAITGCGVDSIFDGGLSIFISDSSALYINLGFLKK